jgi:hypothetical protein
MLASLGARVHLFVQPSSREAFVSLFRDVLKCNVVERDFGLAHPILFVGFSDGSGFSVEFCENAPPWQETSSIDDARSFRGAWIEFRAADPSAVRKALRAAGIPEFRHTGSNHDYFCAPGGQVFRIIDLNDNGP